MHPCGLIVLAAGASSRLQQAKQLLPYEGTTLLQHSVQTALSASVNPVVVVSGACSNMAVPEHDRLHMVHNHAWKEGLASSIRCGLSTLLSTNPLIESVILMVCDQPFVTTRLLNELMEASAEHNKEIVACSYRNTLGTPVFFRKKYFGQLSALQGDEGAKRIIRQNMHDVATIPFPNGEIDIDTIEDYENIQHMNK